MVEIGQKWWWLWLAEGSNGGGRQLENHVGEEANIKEPKALVTLDGEGVDWTSHSQDEQENYALMAYSNSGSDTEREQLGDASIEIQAYTQALKKVEAQLVDHQQNQLCSPPKLTGDFYILLDLILKYDESHVYIWSKHLKLVCESVARRVTLILMNPFYEETLKSMPCPNEPVVMNPSSKSKPKVWSDAPIIKEYESDSDDDCDYPQRALKNKWIIDSGCSRHMTGNKAYLAEYQDYNGGHVVFEDSKGYTSKDTECLVLSPDFKLPDENQVLLRVPRQNNMYSFNLENIVPSRCLACLIAKATVDESNKWHKRLGHVNFKNLNKLVKGNLPVRSENQANKHTGPKEANHSADQEDQVFLEELERLKSQEKETNDAAEAFRKEFAQDLNQQFKQGAMCTKFWAHDCKYKKDERGVVVRNKPWLVARDIGTRIKDIDFDEMNVKSAFPLWHIDEEERIYQKSQENSQKNEQARTRERKSEQKPEAKPGKSSLSQIQSKKSQS
ncbi:ribonuclease H-like domain-containing protein [Tanacetum coccineum]